MPIDEDLLATKKDSIDDKVKLLYQEIEKLSVIRSNIISISLMQNPKFPRDRTKQVLPNDPLVGGKISSARRQKNIQ